VDFDPNVIEAMESDDDAAAPMADQDDSEGVDDRLAEAIEMVILNAPRPVGIFHSFYEECRDNPAFAAYPIPILILHGQYDDFIPMADIQLLRNMNDRSKLVIIPGASHRFLEPGAWDMVLDLTRDWFACEQVLLAESI
jgi:pimeloyl-ACP methyl ester carboxylesterase